MTVDPKRVQSLFVQTIDLSSVDARRELLDRECADDPDLRERVEVLLKAHDDPQEFLDSPSGDPSGNPEATIETSVGERPGTLVADRYKLLEEIGEGGMGTVWVAEQARPVRRKVAIKLVKPGMDSRQVLSRFEAERQALALMDHPNIARVFDGGITDRGRPFFVMEYVKGTPITEYCDHNQLPVGERLQLFMQVCQAIQHAHQKGIIHRDLKPSNILVCQYDGHPVPKVIDFGLAKAMHQPLTEHTLYTSHGLMVGTPLYMSPEQAESNNLDVDTRTDVYSLGVILYELLTGSTPIEKQQFKNAALQEIMRLIKESEPPKPSTRLSGSATVPSVAAQRSLEPAQLSRAIRGDLDWIVMKALDKDRARRYETAIGLAQDLRRHLANEPVTARSPSAGYRLVKLWQRNRVAFFVSASIAVALTAGTCVSLWQAALAREASRAAQAASADATKKQIAAEKAKGEAERERARANQETRRADVQRTSALRHLYAAKTNLLQKAWEQNDVARVWQLLEETSVHSEREFEWYYWQNQLRLDRLTLRGHSSRVDVVAFSLDGQRVFSAGGDHVVRIWDATSGNELQQLSGHTGQVFSLAVSPDGKTLVTGSWDNTVKLWDTESGNLMHTLKGHGASVRSVAISRTGLIATADSENVVIVWDAVDMTRPPKEVWRISKAGTSVDISPEGTRLVACSFSRPTMKMWDIPNKQETLDFKIDSNAVRAIFSPDGQRIVSTHVDQTVVMWSATGTELYSKRKHHSGFINGLDFSPDGKRFVMGGDDHTVRVWDSATGRELQMLRGHSGIVRGAAFSPDGQQIASVSWDKTVKVWDSHPSNPAPGQIPISGHQAPIRCVAYSPDGQQMATASEDQTAILRSLPQGAEKLRLAGHKDWISAVAYSRDAQRVVTGSDDCTAIVWSALTGRRLATFQGHGDRVLSVDLSPDGKYVVTGGWDGRAFVWDIESAMIVLRLVGHAGPVWAVAFSPNGRQILTGSEDRSLRLWDASSGEELSVLNGHEGAVRCVAFSSESDATKTVKLVSGSVDGTARIWHVSSEARLHTTLRGHNGPIRSVRYSGNGRRVVTAGADQTIRIWDTGGGAQLLSIDTLAGQLLSADFAADGHSLFGAFSGPSIGVWESMSPQVLAARQREERQEIERVEATARDVAEESSNAPAHAASPPGSVKRWLILSPIRLSTTEKDNESMRLEMKKKQISEEEISKGTEHLLPRQGECVKIGNRELVWRETKLDNDYVIEFDSLLGRGTSWPSFLAYAVTYIYSETERDVQMKIGWDDDARVFLNGERVIDLPGSAFARDARTVPDIHLNIGRNVLLVKVANGIGQWRCSVRFTDAAGNPVTDLRISSDPDSGE